MPAQSNPDGPQPVFSGAESEENFSAQQGSEESAAAKETVAPNQPARRKRKYNHLVKLLLVGDSGVGKTCLLTRYANDKFENRNHMQTIGIDYKTRSVEVKGTLLRLQIWDTAGQERFRTITRAYYRGAHGIVFVYDICDRKSFENITAWLQSAQEHSSKGVTRMLVGTKCDKGDQRKVSHESGNQLALAHQMSFLETSAKTNVNVEETFAILARDVKEQLDAASAAPEQSEVLMS